MRSNKTSSFLSLLFLALMSYSSISCAQSIKLSTKDSEAPKFAHSITGIELKKKLAVLSSDSLEGRETGTEGAEKAAKFIAKTFRADGLTAPVSKANHKKSYFLPIPLKQWVPQNGTLMIGNLSFESGKDFLPVSRDANLKQDFRENPVYIGYHQSSDSSHALDFQGLDIQGQIVILVPEKSTSLSGGIQGMIPLYNFFRKLRLDLKPLLDKKPRAIFITNDQTASLAQNEIFNKFRKSPQMGFDPNGVGSPLGIFLLSPEATEQILGLSSQSIASLKAKPAGPITLAQELHLNIPLKVDDVAASDVLGFMEGTDLKDQVLVLSAHYDHLGKHDGKIYHGADDDGSGTAALLTMADAFSKAKKAGHGPRRSILFLANVGEEKGLLGSYYYSEHPVFPVAKTITDLNVDMIGRVDSAHIKDSAYVYVIGSGKLSSTLQNISETVNKKFMNLSLDYTYDSPTDPNQFYYRSDHYNFARLGIPIIFYFNGVHEDYHQPTDVIEKINFGIYSKRTQLVFYTAWDLANRTDRPIVDRKSDFK